MDATWHARPRGSATWTHARLRGMDDVYTIYIIIIIIKFRGPPCIRGRNINIPHSLYILY